MRIEVNSFNVLPKRQYFTKRIFEHKGNIKEKWKISNGLLNKRKKHTSLKDGYVEILERKEIPSVMNGYHCSVGEEWASKIYETQNPLLRSDYTVNVTYLS